jgi:hypothetical protein
MTAPLVGRFVDKLNGWTTTAISIAIGIVFQVIFTGAAGLHIAAVVIVCFGELLCPFHWWRRHSAVVFRAGRWLSDESGLQL